MALFTQSMNPQTGERGWQVHREDEFDYYQEIANAGFADMLHDHERNQKFKEAIARTIACLHAEGREVHVLDIGTGTGILSMIALAAGADTVTACEAFRPMADCAERIMHANGVADRVRLVKKCSLDLRIGVDMPQRANLLVAELLDTELIGEGAIAIYNHAHKELLSADAFCIPARARCYVQLAESPLGAQFNTLKALPSLDGDILLQPPPTVTGCSGEATALHDLQLSQLPSSQFRLLSAPTELCVFDFTSNQPLPTQRNRRLTLRSIAAGSTDMIFFWWAIDMDIDGDIHLSCAPSWAHPDAAKKEKLPWRDHWMQAIYYVPRPLHLSAIGTTFLLRYQHDAYSWCFDVCKEAADDKDAVALARNSCSCGLHQSYARSRIGQLNQTTRNKRYMRQLEQTISPESHVLCLGDIALLGLSTAKLGAASVVCLERHPYSRRFVEGLLTHNSLQDRVRTIQHLKELAPDAIAQLTHIFAEPYFLSAMLPWHNFRFGRDLRELSAQLSPGVRVLPHAARLLAMPVEFDDLHKVRRPLGRNCEGFDLRDFDKMVDQANSLTQVSVDPQPLWEYPCRALAMPQELLSVTFTAMADHMLEEQPQHNAGSFPFEAVGSCNGIVCWVDWQLDVNDTPQSIVTTGPVAPIIVGDYVQWDMFVRQGVLFVRRSVNVVDLAAGDVRWELDYDPEGDIKFRFSFEKKPKPNDGSEV